MTKTYCRKCNNQLQFYDIDTLKYKYQQESII